MAAVFQTSSSIDPSILGAVVVLVACSFFMAGWATVVKNAVVKKANSKMRFIFVSQVIVGNKTLKTKDGYKPFS